MIEDYDKLIKDYKNEFPFKDENKTIFEIAKIDKNENVWSNILAFFLDPKNDGQIAQIFIESLYFCIRNSKHEKIENLPDKPSFDKIEIKREVLTKGKGSSRLDLLLKTPELYIGIENKVYHKLNNPLEEYKELLKDEVKEKKSKYILIILTFTELKEAKDANFEYPIIYYSEFFRNVKNRIGKTELENKEYENIVNEFIDLGNKLSQKIELDKAEQAFFKKNEPEINSFIERYNEIKASCESRLKMLKRELSNERKNIDFKIWKKECLYFEESYQETERKDLKIVMDILLTVTGGWEIHVFFRDTSEEELVEKIIEKIKEKGLGQFKVKEKNKEKDKDIRAISQYEYFTSIDDIKVIILEIIELFLPSVSPTKEE